ncbi:MAG TPA: vanadium-dependent haloperoxidase [Longimicrobium sp.]|nr:vanadium-dependent haloperoxidase [Longimicrobium sp.]
MSTSFMEAEMTVENAGPGPGGECVVPEYDLRGPQVEPEASYWNHCPQLRLVSIDELTAITDNPDDPGFFPPYPDPCDPRGRRIIEEEMRELLELQRLRDDPCALESPGDCPALGKTPCDFVERLPSAFGCRAPVSRLFDLQPPPLGAVQANRLPGQRVIRTGRGMARAVEAETPGLFHRHALNYLITTRSWSPPRQALVWAALDVAIASALQAAWYYKWLGERPGLPPDLRLTSRRERPIEYALRNRSGLDVLFDRPDELNPSYILCPDARPCGDDRRPVSPGTPRHPAYPSGHSTYAGAASTVLAFFFGNDCTPEFLTGGAPPSTIGEELRNMADNIGMGRLWAGIHWRSDHEAGLKLGQVVGCLVIRQLAAICGSQFDLCGPMPMMMIDPCDCAQRVPCDDREPPSIERLRKEAERCEKACREAHAAEDPKPCPAPEREKAATPEGRDLRSVQQGAR